MTKPLDRLRPVITKPVLLFLLNSCAPRRTSGSNVDEHGTNNFAFVLLSWATVVGRRTGGEDARLLQTKGISASGCFQLSCSGWVAWLKPSSQEIARPLNRLPSLVECRSEHLDRFWIKRRICQRRSIGYASRHYSSAERHVPPTCQVLLCHAVIEKLPALST